jgi:hypothetical protein
MPGRGENSFKLNMKHDWGLVKGICIFTTDTKFNNSNCYIYQFLKDV